MYTRVDVDTEAILDNGERFEPVATLADAYGGRAQIAIDDHCYVLYLRQAGLFGKEGRYKRTAWIFREAFEVLKELPSPC